MSLDAWMDEQQAVWMVVWMAELWADDSVGMWAG